MLLHKNRLIFGVIRRIIKTVFSFCYKIIRAFNLHLTLFVLLLGIILAIVGVINKNSVTLVLYLIALILTVVFALTKTLKNIFGIKSKSGQVSIVKVEDKPNQQSVDQTKIEQNQSVVQAQTVTPKFYTVKSNPSYVYAEYDDKYELFLKTSSGLKKIRVDYKTQR